MNDDPGWVTWHCTLGEIRRMEQAWKDKRRFEEHFILDFRVVKGKNGEDEAHVRLSDGLNIRVLLKKD